MSPLCVLRALTALLLDTPACVITRSSCWGVELKDDMQYTCMQLSFFRGPWIDDYVSESDVEDDEAASADTESD